MIHSQILKKFAKKIIELSYRDLNKENISLKDEIEKWKEEQEEIKKYIDLDNSEDDSEVDSEVDYDSKSNMTEYDKAEIILIDRIYAYKEVLFLSDDDEINILEYILGKGYDFYKKFLNNESELFDIICKYQKDYSN
jgi:hypothetical protein